MNRPPVTDWATDFDHLDPGFVEDPHAVYSRLRDECPVAHTDRYHGVWIPTRYEDLAAIAHDLGIPVRFIGTGEKMGDLAPFDARDFVDALLG